jgi:hypothetical protein
MASKKYNVRDIKNFQMTYVTARHGHPYPSQNQMTFPYSGLKSLLMYIEYVIKYGRKESYCFCMCCIFCVIRLAAVDFYEFVINACQSHCCIQKMKVFGKFFVQFENFFPRLIIVNNRKGIKYFLVNNVMCWN